MLLAPTRYLPHTTDRGHTTTRVRLCPTFLDIALDSLHGDGNRDPSRNAQRD